MVGTVVGLMGEKNASKKIYDVLSYHQPFDYAGIYTYDGNINHKKGIGNFYEVFSGPVKEIKKSLSGEIGIGHAGKVSNIPKEYDTEEKIRVYVSELTQPEYLINPFIFGANIGRICNWEESIEGLDKLRSNSSVQPLVHNLKHELKNKKNIDEYDIIEAGGKIINKVRGAYSGVYVADQSVDNEDAYMFSITDPNGIRPLFLGKKGKKHCFASDKISLMELGYKKFDELPRGTVSVVDGKGNRKSKTFIKWSKKPCLKNFIYNMEPNCEISGKEVYGVRFDMGKMLYRKNPIKTDVVCGVPHMGSAYAEGFSAESGIEKRTGLIKVGEEKEFTKSKKSVLMSNGQAVRGSKVSLVEHDIIEPEAKDAINILKDENLGGAKEVHFYVACPPLLSDCYLGTKTEQYMKALDEDKEVISREIISEELGCDSLTWLEKDELKSITSEVCSGCLEIVPDGYPLEIKDFVSKLHFKPRKV